MIDWRRGKELSQQSRREKHTMEPEDLQQRWEEQAAQASAAASQDGSLEVVCEQCGQPLQARGRAKRRWQTHGEQQVEVERTYVSCPQCGSGFFPPG